MKRERIKRMWFIIVDLKLKINTHRWVIIGDGWIAIFYIVRSVPSFSVHLERWLTIV